MIAELVNSLALTTKSRVGKRLLSLARGTIISMGHDPLVPAQVGCLKLMVPFSHDFKFHEKAFPEYSRNLPRIAKSVKRRYPAMTGIDIGANVGDTVGLLRTQSEFPILCVEGDSRFFSILKANMLHCPEISLCNCFVSDVDGTIAGTTKQNRGTLHIDVTDKDTKIQTKTLRSIIHEHPTFSKSKLLKIDTDGFDFRIIASSIDWLEHAKPVLFVEYDPRFLAVTGDNSTAVFTALHSIGYRKMLVYSHRGDFACTVALGDAQLVEELHAFLNRHKGSCYVDVCVFHEEDEELHQTIRREELEHFGANLK